MLAILINIVMIMIRDHYYFYINTVSHPDKFK